MKSIRRDYPRPQLMRSEWTDLSGLWDFAFDDENIGVRKSWFKGFSSDINRRE